jgi:hypothetical protein
MALRPFRARNADTPRFGDTDFGTLKGTLWSGRIVQVGRVRFAVVVARYKIRNGNFKEDYTAYKSGC